MDAWIAPVALIYPMGSRISLWIIGEECKDDAQDGTLIAGFRLNCESASSASLRILRDLRKFEGQFAVFLGCETFAAAARERMIAMNFTHPRISL